MRGCDPTTICSVWPPAPPPDRVLDSGSDLRLFPQPRDLPGTSQERVGRRRTEPHTLEIVLISVALALAAVACAGVFVVWHASRAQHVRAFDARVEENLQNAQRRIEQVEARMLEWVSVIEDSLDRYQSLSDRTEKERKRVEVANKRAEMLGGAGPNGPDADPMPDPGDRDATLRWVDRQLARQAGAG